MSRNLRSIALRWFDEWWNLRRDEVLEEVTAEDCIAQVEGLDGGLDRDGLRQHREAWLNAIPDLYIEMPHTSEGDRMVVVQWRLRGTHLGSGLGIPPSGMPIDISGFTTVWFRDDRIVRGVDRWNRGEFIASLMQLRMREIQKAAGLTPRQSQVALLMADGLTHKEIAIDLSVSPNTARRHCERVLQKLGVGRRQDVARALGKFSDSALKRHGSDIAE